jgi:tRNA A-37 threonylcarbamoyl transferase component Bud32
MDDPDVLGGRYALGPVIGRGGMGEVRAATDQRLGREVAIKLLRAELADQAGTRARFEREAQVAARIRHPHVVAIYDVGEDHEVPFIVMERLPGNTLADEIANGPLTEARACTLAAEILSALAAAHDLGVVHRDVKPGNVLLDAQGHATVADFGIAKIGEDGDTTTVGLVLGTASYLAPERLAGEAATAASDIYAVGVLLFEALAGRPPFRGDTPLALVESILRGQPDPIRDLRPDLDPAVVGAIERAMRSDPAQRFASATEMARALAPAEGEANGAFDATVPIAAVAAIPTEAVRAEPTLAAEPTMVLAPARVAGHPPPRRAPKRRAAVIAATGAIVALLAAAAFAGFNANGVPRLPGSPSTTAGLRRAVDPTVTTTIPTTTSTTIPIPPPAKGHGKPHGHHGKGDG